MKLTDLQRESLKRAIRRFREARELGEAHEWIRSLTAGERVTLASLERAGYLERRPWRGDGISRDSAFEYRISDQVRKQLERSHA